jgi:LruC domain-containing protein
MRLPPLLKPVALACTGLLCGFSYVGSTVEWAYHGTPLSGGLHYNQSTGEPNIAEFSRTLPSNLPALPSNLASKIGYTLPEGKDIRKNAQGLLPDSDDKTNLRFSEDAEVWVTFLSEGAGYRNSVGWFRYNQASPPRFPSDVQEKIIFANASMSTPLDQASSSKQNTVYLGQFKAGEALGFMIAANGFSNSGRTFNGQRIGGVSDKPNPKWVFYTLRGLNPEASSAQALNVHTVMLKDLGAASADYQRVVIGFEDINREVGGDHDFNDVVLAIHVTPGRSVTNLSALPTLVGNTDADSDGDGVKDSLDEFPSDSSRAFTRYYPSRDGWGTLAYEDLWPARGDYDLNDLVVRYRSREVLNAARNVVSLEVDYRLDARGGDIRNGFAVHFPGIARSAVQWASLSRGSAAAQTITPETGQSQAVLQVFNDSVAELPPGQGNCIFVNTQAECPKGPTQSYKLAVQFTTPQTGSSLVAPYNPFIFRTTARGHEVHLPGKPATDLVDTKLLGTKDDRSVPAQGKTYRDANGRPWALDLPVEWRYPNETIDLTVPYPNMAVWASTSGAQYNNWYVSATEPKWLWVGQP